MATSWTSGREELQVAFLALVPKIEMRVHMAFAYLNCANERADKVAEALALAWKWFVRLHDRGKNAATFPIVFAALVVRAVASGRRIAGGEPTDDVMSKIAQRKHGFSVTLFSSTARPAHEIQGHPHGQKAFGALDERLADNTRTPVPEQAAFRIDFPAWLGTLSSRERTMAQAMMRDEGTNDLSRAFGVSAGRVSQLRRELRDGWERFCDEA
jgi:hypothetical protein